MKNEESPLRELTVTVLAGCATAWLEGYEFEPASADQDGAEAVVGVGGDRTAPMPAWGDDSPQRIAVFPARWQS
jgi:hypothetical protein